MAIRFRAAASRHGIGHDRSAWVVERCPCPLYSSDPENQDQLLFLWPDNHGVPLEVLAIELADGDLLVIHAMKMRSKYQDDYARVMKCL